MISPKDARLLADTHEVVNVSCDLVDYNMYLADAALQEAVHREGAALAHDEHAYESMECIGGSGVMEDSTLSRLFRESPINAIWEGSGNIQCLDVLRAMQKTPSTVSAFFVELAKAKGGNAALDAAVEHLQHEFTDLAEWQYRGRDVVDRMALTLQGALLVQHAPAFVADALCASRLAGGIQHNYGALPRAAACAAIIDRAMPRQP